MKMRSVIGIGLACLVASLARTGGEATRIEGTVTYADTGSPVGGAQVFVPGTTLGTRTNARGGYALELGDSFATGTRLTLTVRLVGFDEASSTVTVGPAEIQRVDFSLERADPDDEGESVSGGETAGPPVLDAARERADLPQLMKLPGQVLAEAPVSNVAGRIAGDARYGAEPFNMESYARIDENGWRLPTEDPLSTFSIDVDRASYSNIRRFITRGERPPVDAVRIEEMVNYFTYDYPAAGRDHPFTVSTEVSAAPWNEAHRLVRVGVQGRAVDMDDLPPSNLVFLLDVSGSMQAPTKLPLLKRSLRLLVNELRPDDRVAIVVYAGAAGLALESTPGRHRERILEAIEGLEAGGSTAGGAGLRLAYRVAAENFLFDGNNRVILATDGDFNVGQSSDAAMTRLIEERRDEGTFLTVLGFGMRNLKDSKMEALADHGNGNYAYIDSLLEARKVLVTEMGGTLLTIAKDVKIQVEFNPNRVKAYRLIGYENRLLAAEDFNDDTKDAGELGAGHTVTALYEVVPPGVEIASGPGIDPLRYQSPPGDGEGLANPERAPTDELLFVKLRYKQPLGDHSTLIEHPVSDRVTRPSADTRFAAAVAAFGMILRDSEHCGDFTLRDVSRLARGAVGDDRHGYRSEFVHLVEQTRTLGLLSSR